MADMERGRRLAEAATKVIAAAKNVAAHHMPATEDCSVVLTGDLEELTAAIEQFDYEREGGQT